MFENSNLIFSYTYKIESIYIIDIIIKNIMDNIYINNVDIINIYISNCAYEKYFVEKIDEINIVNIINVDNQDRIIHIDIYGSKNDINIETDIVLINPIAKLAAKILYLEDKKYFNDKYNSYFIEKILDTNLLSDEFIKRYKNKLLPLSYNGLFGTINKLREICNFNIELNQIRIFQEVLLVFEKFKIDPFAIDATGSYIMFCSKKDLEYMDSREIIYNKLGNISTNTEIFRGSVKLAYIKSYNNILVNNLAGIKND